MQLLYQILGNKKRDFPNLSIKTGITTQGDRQPFGILKRIRWLFQNFFKK